MIVNQKKFKSKWEKIDSFRIEEIDDHEIITAKFNNTHLGIDFNFRFTSGSIRSILVFSVYTEHLLPVRNK